MKTLKIYYFRTQNTKQLILFCNEAHIYQYNIYFNDCLNLVLFYYYIFMRMKKSHLLFVIIGIFLILFYVLAEKKISDYFLDPKKNTPWQEKNIDPSFQDKDTGNVIDLNKDTGNVIDQEEWCIEDFQEKVISSKPQQKSTLTSSGLQNFKNIIGIDSFCISKKLGQLFLNVDWDSNAKVNNAESWRMISLGFENLYNNEVGWWGNGYLVYSTYDFAIGTIYEIYATKWDYEEIKNNQKKNIIEINGIKGFVQYKSVSYYGNTPVIQKAVVFPFENYYIAVVYGLMGDYSQNHDEVISALYNNTYPQEDSDNLQLVDKFVKSIKFTNKQ